MTIYLIAFIRSILTERTSVLRLSEAPDREMDSGDKVPLRTVGFHDVHP
jgi:hypothetical protein